MWDRARHLAAATVASSAATPPVSASASGTVVAADGNSDVLPSASVAVARILSSTAIVAAGVNTVQRGIAAAKSVSVKVAEPRKVAPSTPSASGAKNSSVIG